MNRVSKMAVALVAAGLLMTPASVEAGGSWGGSSGGGYSASGGSSGGGGFFSRLRARHAGSHGGSRGGSTGRHVVASGSRGGSSGGSSGGASSGPIRTLISKIRARRAASGSHGGSSGGSRGGSSGGQVRYASYSGGSSGGGSSGGGSSGGSSGGTAVSYSAPSYSGGGSSGGKASVSYASYSAPVTSVSMADTAVYESPIVESSYETYAPAGETIIDSGYSTGSYDTGEVIMGETIIDGGYDSGSVMGETIIDGGYDAGIPLGANDASQDSSIDQDRYEVSKPAVDDDAAMLAVRVPESATVTVNGHETSSDGELRQFLSRGLKEGFVYTYVVNVSFDEGTSESKSVQLRPGDYEEITFEDKAPAKTVSSNKPVVDDSVITVVQLHVPAGARVSLAGNPTNGTGKLRTFRTKQLKRGEQWADYTVEVTAEIDGQMVTKERTVNVQAGSLTELTFDFEQSPIASR